MIAYTVTCTFQQRELADEWVAWMLREHMKEVCDAGALDAEIIRMDGAPIRCEARYHFDSREAFAVYERDHAPSLRAEGLKRFPIERGVQYARSLGEVCAHLP